MLAAVTQNGVSLQYASAGFRADKEVVLAAVTQDGTALQFAAAGLNDDMEVVLAPSPRTGWRFITQPWSSRLHRCSSSSPTLSTTRSVETGGAVPQPSRELKIIILGDDSEHYAIVSHLQFQGCTIKIARPLRAAVIKGGIAIVLSDAARRKRLHEAAAMVTTNRDTPLVINDLGGNEYLLEVGWSWAPPGATGTWWHLPWHSTRPRSARRCQRQRRH